MGIRLVYGLKTNDLSYLKEFYPSRRLAEAAASLSLDYGELLYPPGSPFTPILSACQGHLALFRGELPMALYETLESSGLRVVNSAASTALARDKYRSASFFKYLGLAHPRTLCFSLPAAVNRAAEPRDEPGAPPAPPALPLPLPFVAKPRCGKMGRGVALIESPQAWQAYAQAHEGEFIAQDYIASSFGRDIRFFFAAWPGGKPWLCVQRQGLGFLSNAHAGGRMSLYEPPAGLVAEAERAFAASGLSYGSVDFLFADGAGSSFLIGEVNACPGFEELERACGLDAAAAILKAATGQAGAKRA
ncbi:MAG TPA: hypothetical protein DCG47_06840 [Spirochaetaceae bacterium]|nr:hypothetical protein [Spirochaetaceae bacterium]